MSGHICAARLAKQPLRAALAACRCLWPRFDALCAFSGDLRPCLPRAARGKVEPYTRRWVTAGIGNSS
jgi:hypothetical protein